MAKSTTAICIETEVLDYHRRAHSNISRLCNDYLKRVMVGEIGHTAQIDRATLEKQIQDGQKQIAEAKKQLDSQDLAQAEQEKAKNKANLTKVIMYLRLLNKAKEGDPIKSQEFYALFNETIQKYGISRAELVDLVEFKKEVK